jgi:hypothetical protein
MSVHRQLWKHSAQAMDSSVGISAGQLHWKANQFANLLWVLLPIPVVCWTANAVMAHSDNGFGACFPWIGLFLVTAGPALINGLHSYPALLSPTEVSLQDGELVVSRGRRQSPVALDTVAGLAYGRTGVNYCFMLFDSDGGWTQINLAGFPPAQRRELIQQIVTGASLRPMERTTWRHRLTSLHCYCRAGFRLDHLEAYAPEASNLLGRRAYFSLILHGAPA